MNEDIKKYQNNNINIEDYNKDNKNKVQIKITVKKPNHIILESKYEKPDSKKKLEQKIENTQEISRNKYGDLSVISGKNNLINNNSHNSVNSNVKPKEKDIRQNKENINYRKINQKTKTEKDQKEGIKYGYGIEKEAPKEKSINYRYFKEEENCYDENNKMNKYNNDKNDNKTYIYNSCNIYNIKSIFILKGIFSYISDLNFEYKLIKYSKLLQKKFKLDLKDYIKKYSEQLHFEKLVDEPLIQSSSPLFAKLISNDIIYISQDNLEKDKFKSKYCEILNKPNLNYSSIYYIFNNKNFYDNFLDNLKELNIDFNKIKVMTLYGEKYIQDNININDPNVDFNKIKAMILHPEFFITDNYNYFLKSLFSLNDIKNNLICLKIYFGHKHCVIKADSFEEINNMKLLKYLYIININFDKNIEIKLNNLKILYCNKCKNANSIYINCKNLKKLYYINNNISNLNNFKEKFEKLEILDLSNNALSNIDILNYINSKELKVLNLSNNEISNIEEIFKNLNLEKLEVLNLNRNKISNINILEKINFNELKKLDLSDNKISDIEVLEKVKFKNLDKLDLSGNNIMKNNNGVLKIKNTFKNKLILY